MKDGISLKNVLNAISWQFSNALLSRDAAQRFQMTKTRQKLNLKAREIDWLYLWHMTYFENKAHAITGNGNHANLLKSNF